MTTEDWKNQPPYRVQAQFEGIYEASCHCGRVKYQLNKEKPLDAKYCHCRDCQRLHGAPFQWAAIFHKEDINFLHGTENLAWYASDVSIAEHRLPCKVSCAYCRTPIMDEGRRMILLFPTLIQFKSIEDRQKFAPSCHIFYAQRVLDIPDGQPKWSRMDKTSQRMDSHV